MKKKTYITEVGTVMLAVGGAALAGSEIGTLIGPWGMWLKLAGTMLSVCGTALIGFRVSKKLDK